MSFSYIWDDTFESLPDNNTYGYEIDDYFRKLYVAIRERMQVDHIWKIGDADGEHSKITLNSPIDTPLPITDKGFIYLKDVNAKAELHFEDEDGNEIELTKEGKINTAGMDAAAIALAVLPYIYPVGKLYHTIDPTNPATILGFGTWTLWGAGKVPVCVNTADSDFNTVEKAGGEKTHLLLAAESGLVGHGHGLPAGTTGGGNYVSEGSNDAGTPAVTDDVAAANAVSAHNNLQPYITCYIWKRTA